MKEVAAPTLQARTILIYFFLIKKINTENAKQTKILKFK